jgi:hypothetical protein
MAGYVYRGTDFDVSEPTKPLAVRRYAGAVCGTRPGYMKHRANDEDPCPDCVDANASYSRDYRERVKARSVKRGWSPAKCGTLSGHRAHYRHSVPLCEPCRVANAAACKDRRDAKKAA